MCLSAFSHVFVRFLPMCLSRFLPICLSAFCQCVCQRSFHVFVSFLPMCLPFLSQCVCQFSPNLSASFHPICVPAVSRFAWQLSPNLFSCFPSLYLSAFFWFIYLISRGVLSTFLRVIYFFIPKSYVFAFLFTMSSLHSPSIVVWFFPTVFAFSHCACLLSPGVFCLLFPEFAFFLLIFSFLLPIITFIF